MSANSNALRKDLYELESHLTLRTFVVGYCFTFADLTVWGTIRGNHVALGLIKNGFANIARWYNFIEASQSWVLDAVAELTTHSKTQRLVPALRANYHIDLPKIDGPLITRFPPEPSGYLHIGHAKAALLNDFFANKDETGMLICRFDDTNPSKESMEFQDAILDDLKLMEIIPQRISYSSDYFEEMYQFAIQLIKDGKAFAEDAELGKGGQERRDRQPSKRRDLGKEETLARFNEMKMGSEEGRRWCLRAKIAFDSSNGSLRDPVIYRCNPVPHHRTGSKWKIYPTYDFCAPILDSLEGVTLALRTNEYRDRNAQYEWIQDALGIRKVPIWDFSRLNFSFTVLSKRKLSRIVNEGRVWGWDDPRMPTIRGVLRRGMTVTALKQFILNMGPSRNVVNLEWDQFWAMNKKYIDPQAPRYTAISEKQAVWCRVLGQDIQTSAEKPRHNKNPDLGMKTVLYDKHIIIEQVDAQSFAKDEKLTLMNWANAYVRNISKDVKGGHVTVIDFELDIKDQDFKKTKKITWLAATNSNQIPVDLVSFDHLITKAKLNPTDELEDFLNPVTEFHEHAFADCNMTTLEQGTIIQFERKGYFKLDVAYKGESSRMIFFNVPSGKV